MSSVVLVRSSASASESFACPSEASSFCTSLGEGALVEDRVAEPVEIGAGLILDEGAPQIDQARARRAAVQAGQPLAHQHRDRLLERRLVAVARLGEGAAVKAVVEHGGEVGRDALHAARADRFDPRLLDRVEQRARRRVLRREPAMDRVVVAGEPQRERIGEAAHDRRLARVRLARRLGQARLGAFRRR